MKSRIKANGFGFTEGRVVAAGVRRTGGRGICANVEVEDSSRGTRGQLVGGTVEVQVDEFFRGLQKSEFRSLPERASARVRGSF